MAEHSHDVIVGGAGLAEFPSQGVVDAIQGALAIHQSGYPPGAFIESHVPRRGAVLDDIPRHAAVAVAVNAGIGGKPRSQSGDPVPVER